MELQQSDIMCVILKALTVIYGQMREMINCCGKYNSGDDSQLLGDQILVGLEKSK